MNDAHTQAILSALRSILIAIGGVLAQRGFMTDAAVQEVVGAIMVIVPAVWAAWDHYRVEAATKAREHIAVNAGIIKADSTVGPTPLVSPENTQAVIAEYKPLATDAPTNSPQGATP